MDRWFNRPSVLLTIVGLALTSIVLTAPAQATLPWSWGPVIGAVSETTVSLTWKTTRAVGFDFSYALAPIYDSTGQWEETFTYNDHDGVAEIWLQDLLPGTLYRYQLIFYEGDAVYPTEVGSFRTIDPDIRAFSFATYGATASYPDRHKLVAEAILDQTDPMLVFHGGNLVEYPTEEHFRNFYWALSDLGRSQPYLAVIGGHDGDADLYYENFALPSGGGMGGEQWWSFDYGLLHFVGLDSTLSSLSEEAAMQEQTEWLEQDLQAAAGQIIIVFAADPLYSASYDTGQNDRLVNAWSQLFYTYDVDIVISSAIHCYEHIYRQGTHYVASGGGGAPLAASPGAAVQGTVFRRYGLLHYIEGTLADTALQIKAIPVASITGDTLTLSATGRSIDTFVVEKTP